MPKNYMDQLPDEVLCMVFDRLDFDSLKTASRTCQRWNAIIFFSGYMDRIRLDINILNRANRRSGRPDERQLKRLLRRAKQLVTQTQRHYRGLSLGIEPLTELHFPAIWKTIHPKISQHLRFLDLIFIEGSVVKVFPLIIAALPSMQHLQVLMVADFGDSPIYQKSIPTLRSQSVVHLSMDCKYKYTIDMPQLKTFDGALCALLPPDGGAQPQAAVLGKLAQLMINVKGWNSPDPAIFRRMPCLERCDLDAPLEDDLFVSMSEACPLLTSLSFSKTLHLSDLSVLKSALELPQLRDLSFHRINMEGDWFLDFSKLTQLKSLDLGRTVVQPSMLLNMPKSIRKLQLEIHLETEQSLIDLMSYNLTHLTELRLRYYRAPASQNLLKSLSLFEQLEVLHFSRCHFTQSCFLAVDAPLPRLQTLWFKKCKLETKHLLGLQAKFPQLKACEFLQCFVMTESDGNDEYDSDDTFESDINSESDYDGYNFYDDSDYSDGDGYLYHGDDSDYELGYEDYELLSAWADFSP